MNILIVTNLYPPEIVGGAEQSVESLSELLAAKGHTVTVLTSGKGLHTERVIERKTDNLSIVRFGSRNISLLFEKSRFKKKLLRPVWHASNLYNPFIPKGFKKTLAESNADIIHVHGVVGIGYNCLNLIASKWTPTVVTFHDFGLVCLNHAMYYKGNPCTHYHASCAFSTSVKVRYLRKIRTLALSAPSEAILTAVCGHLPPLKALRRVVRYPLQFSKQPARSKYADHPQYVFVGQIEEIKGLRFLLETVHPIFERAGGKITILGAGRQLEMLGERYKGSPHVTFKGFVNQATVAEEIANADAMVVPSLWQENSPLVVYHALSYGVPVVASRIGGIPELVTDRENGLLLSPGAGAEWGDTFERISKSSAALKELKAGAEKSKDRLSPERLTDEMIDLYHDTIDLKNIARTTPAPII
ncbi:MAG TPA: glycosyltransferase family 4 protein [Verrucomicrobiae bacterium]|jgi:glycosyltransferase involved in cell wall biosynthesis